MNKILEGRKTFIGIGLVVLGFLGGGDLISEGEVNVGWDAVVQLVGLVVAVIGRIKAKPKVQ